MDYIEPAKDGLGVASQTPLTNRGSLRPKTSLQGSDGGLDGGVNFVGIDYLRVTVFAPAEWVLGAIDSPIELNGGVAVGEWVDQGPARRVLNRWTCGVPGLEVHEAGDYAGFLVKGQAAAVLGHEAIRAAYLALSGARLQATRIDLAWDGFPMTTREVFDHLKAGHVRTRSVLDPHPEGDLDARPSGGKGSTVYTHLKPEKRSIERYVRWYDKRGPTRLELVLKGLYARKQAERIFGSPSFEAQTLSMESLRGFLDLVEPGEVRLARRPLLKQWRDFIGQAGSWTPDRDYSRRVKAGLEKFGVYELAFQRCASRLGAFLDAYGEDALVERVRHHARGRVDQDEVDFLRAMQGPAAARGIAGVPALGGDLDIPL